MFVNTRKPLHVSVPFYSTILREPYAVLCDVTIMSSADLSSQISGRHYLYSNGTKHGIWAPEDGRIKRTETCRGFLVFTNMF